MSQICRLFSRIPDVSITPLEDLVEDFIYENPQYEIHSISYSFGGSLDEERVFVVFNSKY